VTAYTSLWEFIVETEHLDEFERRYGPQGSWAQLFRQSPGYIQTRRPTADSARRSPGNMLISTVAVRGLRCERP
jgi:hypothetical protein